MKKKFTLLIYLIQDILAYCVFRIKGVFWRPKTEKTIYIQVENPNIYHRFFYIFLKNFQRAGYQLVYPLSFSKYRNIKRKYTYLGFIVKEKNLIVYKRLQPKAQAFTINDADLSPNFFQDFFQNSNQESGFHLPLGFHPYMYHKNIDLQEISLPKYRINSLYTFGNFDDKAYLEINKTPFEVINRVELKDIIQEFPNYLTFPSLEKFEDYLLKPIDFKLICIEKKNFALPLEKVRPILAHFNFFLACPGVVMPLCHNIEEAMSVGTIPILQESYAQLLYPELGHRKNAFIFQSKKDLLALISNVLFTLKPEEVEEMRQNVLQFFQQYRSANVLAKNSLENLGKKPIFINAEHRSVDLIHSK